MSEEVKVIIITGTMGTGKTTVMAEASDILSLAGITHAAVDIDALGVSNLPSETAREVECRNLASVYANYREAGVTRLLIAAAVENEAVLNRIFNAMPDAGQIIVCRLKVDLDTARRRVKLREPGMFQKEFMARVEQLERILDQAKLEHFCVCNPEGQVTETAHQVLRGAKWI